MARPKVHLQKAPIVEALIDFRVLRQEQISSGMFSELNALIGAQYSQKSAMQSIQARFGLDRGQLIQPAPVQSVAGWLYKTETEIAQFRLDGFSFSRIEPYTTWEEVFGEALRLWKVYVEVSKPKQTSRVALRYINRMRVPGPADLGEYLAAPPALPKPIPQRIREFLSRSRVEDIETGTSAVITQALEPQLDPLIISLLLDIDVFRDGLTLTPDDASISDIFGTLRAMKNKIFFASITDRTAEMYE